MDLSSRDDDPEPFFHLSSSTDAASAKARKMSGDGRHGFDFSTDDVLPTYDFHQSSAAAGHQTATALEQGSGNRRHRSSGSPVYLTGELYHARKEKDVESYDTVVVSAVERTIKKYADNILRVLEGMSGRLSQLESVSHVLEHSIEKLNVSVDEYHVETDTKMKFLNDHISEMHRSLQILRDRQDIMETHAELARLQASKSDAKVDKPKTTMSESNHSAASEITPLEQQIITSTGQSVHPLAIEAVGKIQQMSLTSDNTAVPQQPAAAQPQPQLPQQQAPVQPQPQTMLQTQPQPQTNHTVQNQMLQTVQAPVQTHPQAHSQYTQQPHLQAPQQLQIPPNMQAQSTTQGQSHHQPPVQPSHQVPMSQVMQQTPPQVQPQMHQLQAAQGQPPQIQPPQLQAAPGQTQQIHQPQLQAAPGQPQQIHQPQGIPQQVHVHQSPAALTPLPQVQYASGGLQTVPVSQQFPATNPQLQPQQIPHNIPPVQQSHQQPLQNSQPQESYQFTQQSESPLYAPLPAAGFAQGPSVQGYAARPFSQSQPLQSLPPQHSISPYPRNPSGPQSQYGSQSSGQNTPLNPRQLPVAQTVYNESPHSRMSNAHYSSYDKITEKVVSMGFPIEEVRSVIRFLSDRGQLVDLNTVLDTLTNGDSSRRGWQGR